jgi:hypothetical protein
MGVAPSGGLVGAIIKIEQTLGGIQIFDANGAQIVVQLESGHLFGP